MLALIPNSEICGEIVGDSPSVLGVERKNIQAITIRLSGGAYKQLHCLYGA